MNGTWRKQYFIWALALAVPGVAPASVIFTNFGAGQSYNTTGGNGVGNDFVGDNLGEGESFTPTANVNFGSVVVALSCSTGCPASDNFTISLNSDSGGMPGAAIESFIFTGKTLNVLGLNNTPITATSLLKPLLTSGTQYWITVTSSIAYAITWNWNTTNDGNSQAISTDGGGSWFANSGLTPGAFEVDSAAIVTGSPEPGAGLLLSTALLALWKFRRRLA
jgi:hypothetical protein